MTTASDLTATDLRAELESGALRVRDIAQACLARIAAREATVEAWAFIDEERVLREAERLDRATERGPLHGIPIGVKDMILTEDMPTGHNSSLYEGSFPQLDAAPVMTLRAAGALLFGKTVTTEFAATQRGAKTRNPHDPARTPGGSSSGSAAAVADHHVPLALGTQTGGSLVRPASFCGVYAYKPSWGVISREGLRQYSISCDTLGIFARAVSDLSLIADVFAIDDAAPGPFALEGARIAICRSPYFALAEPATREALARGEDLLRQAGARVDALTLPAEFGALLDHHRTILNHEGRASFLSEARRCPNDLNDEFRAVVENRTGASLSDVRTAYDAAAMARVAFDEIAAPYDAVLTPSVPGEAPLGLASTGDHRLNSLWTFLHAPVVNIPGFVGPNGMPVSLTLTAPRFMDRPLLRAANAVGACFAAAARGTALSAA